MGTDGHVQIIWGGYEEDVTVISFHLKAIYHLAYKYFIQKKYFCDFVQVVIY